jgi:IclR family transcriptional regulator, mhp operon transcriptional activator
MTTRGPSDARKPSYAPIQSVQRVLAMLRALNQNGVNTVQSIHRNTGLPKPTVVRMLETLMSEGYVTRDERQGGYMVTAMVRSLSCGFHAEPLVVEAGRNFANAFTRRVQWPVSIATLDRVELVIRYSTVVDSPISPDHALLNVRLDMIEKALGLCYLAFCSPGEHAILMRMIEATCAEHLEVAGGRDLLDHRLDNIRKQGFALRAPGVQPVNSGTIAVPIMVGKRVMATLGMSYFRSALSLDDLSSHIYPLLAEAAAGIADQVTVLRESAQAESTELDRLVFQPAKHLPIEA